MGTQSAISRIRVLIPAFNEHHRLPETLRAIAEQELLLNTIDLQVTIVDDGSVPSLATVPDIVNTPNVQIIVHPRNRGKGAAIRTGLQAHVGEWVLISDADLPTPLTELPKLIAIAEANGPDVLVTGARVSLAGTNPVRRNPLRHAAGRIFVTIASVITQVDVYDSQCGFKLIAPSLGDYLARELSIDGFAFDLELIRLAQDRGFKVFEVPVKWSDKPGGTIRLYRDAPQMLWDAVRIRRRLGASRRFSD